MEKTKSVLEFMPSIGSGESPASWTSIIKQIGGETPVIEQEKKLKGFSALEAAGV